jgi:ATP-dependent DNA helicase RecG
VDGITEGRATGIPTIQEEMQKNGSPRATIETNDERSFINVFIPVHEGCGDKVILNDTQSGTQDGTQNGTQGGPLGELDVWIEEQIRKNHNITTEELAKLSKKGIRTIKRHISKLPNIRYVGRGYSGHWEVEVENK